MSRALSLYIHWPFCLSLCPYCDFNSHILADINQHEWLGAYKKELEYFSDIIKDKEITSVFFGGGTPSLMEPFLVAGILDKLSQMAHLSAEIEITIEANPTSYEATKFANFKAAGINRISLGIQSLVDKDLKILGRNHDAGQAIKAIKSASSIFDNYSFDLIYARQNQTLKAWQHELSIALELARDHISLYQLTIEKGTPYFKLFKEGELVLPPESVAANMYEWTNDFLKNHNYELYEISNYAKPSLECRHNLTYWNYKEYLGIGAGAHSRIHNLDGSIRTIVMQHMPFKWLENVQQQSHAILKSQNLSKNVIVEEFIMMGTRLKKGASEESLYQLTGMTFDNILNYRIVEQYIEGGFVRIEDRHLILTPKGLLLHNYLVPRMLKE